MSEIQIASNKSSNVTIDQETIEALRADLRGSLLLPTDAGYDEARRIWNGMIDRRPAMIVRCVVIRRSNTIFNRKAATLIGLATQLHTIAVGNMTPSYQVVDGRVRPVYVYAVDISEFAVNKLRDRGTLGATSIVTNIQDFLVILRRNLIG